MISQLKTEERFDYIFGYMHSGKAVIPFVAAINRYWTSMLYESITSHALSDDLLKSFAYYTLEHDAVDTLERVNITSNLGITIQEV